MWYCTLNKIVTCLWWQSSGCVGCSVVLLDWTVYWSWRVWGKGFIPLLICIFQLCFNHCLSLLETCTSSVGQPCPSFSDGSFLRVARGKCLSCIFVLGLFDNWNKVDLILLGFAGPPICWIWTISRIQYKGEGKDRCWYQTMAGQETKETFLTWTC